jgi:hypothetical protein
MKSTISCNLIFLSSAKLVWERAKEFYSYVNNLMQIYNFQTYFSLTLNDLSLENYYAKIKGICEELKLYQPISSDVRTMQK